ncbi:MAG TPA: DUF2946 family protein [Burkholderiales bacterium]
MDAAVARSMARWPDVPAVYGWLALDRRGGWRIKGERVLHAGLREFIARNYQADAHGRWYFQNGPQRVFVSLAYTPLVVHHEGEVLVDHCGDRVEPRALYLDDEGSLLVEGGRAIALLDDRDLERYAERAERLPRLPRAEVAQRFGFSPEPRPL